MVLNLGNKFLSFLTYSVAISISIISIGNHTTILAKDISSTNQGFCEGLEYEQVGGYYTEMPEQKVHAIIRATTVQVLPQGSSLSGVIVSRVFRDGKYEYSVLTAAHGIYSSVNGENITIKTVDDQSHNVTGIDKASNEAEIPGSDLPVIDLALLQFRSSHCFPVADMIGGFTIPNISIKVVTFAYPVGSNTGEYAFGYANHRFFSTPNARPGGYTLSHTIPTKSGYSGAGIFSNGGGLYAIHGQADTIFENGASIKLKSRYAIPIDFFLMIKNNGLRLDQVRYRNFTSGMKLDIRNDIGDFVAQGRYYMSIGQYRKAENLFDQALYFEPRKEINYIDNAVHLSNDSGYGIEAAGIFRLRANARRMLGNQNGARSDFRSCIKLADWMKEDGEWNPPKALVSVDPSLTRDEYCSGLLGLK